MTTETKSIRLGVDIGGTNIKFAVVEGKTLVYTETIKTADTCLGIVGDVAAKYNELKSKYNIESVGVGTPGSFKDGLVIADNLPFKYFPLEESLKKLIDLPLKVDNDANCAALGEIECGSASGCDNIVVVTIGTGIGGGIVLNRQVCRGKAGFGEIGHMVIQADGGLPCKCGSSGCWEQYASATALVRESERAAKENPDSILGEIFERSGGALNGILVFEAIERGCPVANAVLDKYTDYLVVGLHNVDKIFFPDAILLVGGITSHGDLLMNSIRKKLHPGVNVEVSILQSKAGMLGAALL